MAIRCLVLLLATFLLASVASAQSALRDRLEAIVEQSTIPAIGYAVLEDGEIRDIGVVGEANRRSLFRAGSISKTVTTIMVLSLVNEGVLSLETPLREVLPNIDLANDWAETSPIRLVDLLEQTSGLAGTSYADYGNWPTDIAPARVAEARRFEARWQPGQFFSYANVNHTLAAAMAETRTGTAFDTLVAERVFAPLGMDSASFDRMAVEGSVLGSVHANGRPASYWDLDIRPSGALVGTIDDLAALARFLTTDGATAPERLRGVVPRMRAPESALVARQGYDFIYGAGLFPFVENGRVYYGHWGRIDGFQSVIGTNPERGAAFVLLANGEDRRAFAEARALIAAGVTGVSVTPSEEGPHSDLRKEGWWVPFTDDNVQRAWITEYLGMVHTRVNDGTLLIRPGLAPWTEIEATALTHAQYGLEGFPVATHVFARGDAGETFLLGDSQLTLKRIGTAEAVLRLGGLALFVVSLCVAVGGGLIHAVWRVLGSSQSHSGMWVALGVAAVSAILLMALHVRWGMLAPLGELTALSAPSFRSVTLLGLSLLWPVATLLALVASTRRLAAGAPYIGATGLIVGLAFLLSIAFLAGYGFVPLKTW